MSTRENIRLIARAPSKSYHFQDGGLYTTEFVQINTKINHYPVILIQHNKYEIYLQTYSLIFRKNFLHLK